MEPVEPVKMTQSVLDNFERFRQFAERLNGVAGAELLFRLMTIRLALVDRGDCEGRAICCLTRASDSSIIFTSQRLPKESDAPPSSASQSLPFSRLSSMSGGGL